MKVELTDTGWKEIATRVVKIERFGKKPLMTKQEWLDFNRKFPQIGRKRQKCKCCRTEWIESNSEYVHILFTNQGNQAVCDECFSRLGGTYSSNENTDL
jgi:hypothetical protein